SPAAIGAHSSSVRVLPASASARGSDCGLLPARYAGVPRHPADQPEVASCGATTAGRPGAGIDVMTTALSAMDQARTQRGGHHLGVALLVIATAQLTVVLDGNIGGSTRSDLG